MMVLVEGGGDLDLSQPSLVVARLLTPRLQPRITRAPLSIRVGNQHSFVKAN